MDEEKNLVEVREVDKVKSAEGVEEPTSTRLGVFFVLLVDTFYICVPFMGAVVIYGVIFSVFAHTICDCVVCN